MLSNYFNNENIVYVGEKEVVNRKCREFEGNLKMLDNSSSENLRYHREVYKTEPSIAKLNFCLDNQTAIPLEMTAELTFDTPFYGKTNTTLAYKTTVIKLNVNDNEFNLPVSPK